MHRKMRICAVLVALAASRPLLAETYKVDPVHSGVSFKIRHLVSNVTGSFRQFDGTIQLDPADPTRSSGTFTVPSRNSPP